MMSVVRTQPRRIQVEDVAGLRGCFRPRGRRDRKKLVLKDGLAITEIPCIIFYVGQNPADISCFLGSHAAVLVKIERLVTHKLHSL